MAAPTKLTAPQVRVIAQQTNSTHDGQQQKGLIAAIDAVLPIAATTTVAGTVFKGPVVANAAAAPTKAEFDGLLAALRTAGVIG